MVIGTFRLLVLKYRKVWTLIYELNKTRSHREVLIYYNCKSHWTSRYSHLLHRSMIIEFTEQINIHFWRILNVTFIRSRVLWTFFQLQKLQYIFKCTSKLCMSSVRKMVRSHTYCISTIYKIWFCKALPSPTINKGNSM